MSLKTTLTIKIMNITIKNNNIYFMKYTMYKNEIYTRSNLKFKHFLA